MNLVNLLYILSGSLKKKTFVANDLLEKIDKLNTKEEKEIIET